jgi:tetratricopeptide (TPR) repeat protein
MVLEETTRRANRVNSVQPEDRDLTQSVSAVLSRAVVRHLKGDLDGALQILTNIDPSIESPELFAARGHVQMDLGDFNGAGQSYQSVVELRPQDPEGWFQAGYCLHKTGQTAAALDHLRKAADLGATWIEVPLAIAICLVGLKRYPEALDALETCLEREPDYVPALFTKAVTLHLTWDLAAAAKLYDEVLLHDPSSREALMNMVSLGLQQKNYQLVREYSDRLLTVEPESTVGIEGLALEAFARNDFPGAETQYRRLTALAPDTPEHWLNLGISIERQQQLPAAIAAFEKAFEIRPDSLMGHTCLALALWKNRDLENAKASYESAVAKWPDHDDLTLNLSYVLEEMGHPEAAEHVCDRFCTRKSDSGQVWFRLGYLRLKAGDTTASIQPFEAALNLRPEWPEAEVDLALALFQTGRLGESERVLKGLLGRLPDHVDAVKGLAAIELERGNTRASLALHVRLLDLDHTTAETYYNCGVLAQRLDQTADAVVYYRKALEKQPEFAEALLNLGHALNSEQKPQEAKECWIQALELKPDLALNYFHRAK